MTGDDLRAIRKNLALTQAEFGARLGLSGHFIGEMERGDRAISPRTMVALEGMKVARGEHLIRITERELKWNTDAELRELVRSRMGL